MAVQQSIIVDPLGLSDFNFPTSMEDLKQIMMSGEQSPGTSYYAHGEQVAAAFEALCSIMEHGEAEESLARPNEPIKKWRLPKWLVQHQKWIYEKLSTKMDIYKTYQTWHDCGKPFVKQLDEHRRAHYPDHALISSKAWLAAGGSAEIAKLVEDDMVCHHLRSVPETKALAKEDPNFLALMVTAVCEMHVCQPPMAESEELSSNVCPIDLTTQTGFLIKLKRIQYYGNVMIKTLQSIDNPPKI